jgi:tetratricopeptide (TPR) repeat protein
LHDREPFQSALELWLRLARLQPLEVGTARRVAAAACEAGEVAKARWVLEQALDHHGAATTVHELQLDLGRVLVLADEPELAASALRAAAQSPEATVQAASERLLRFCLVPGLAAELEQGDRALRLGHVEMALRVAKHAVRRAPEIAEAGFLLGSSRARLGHRRRARRALERALQLGPELAEARNRLGITLVELGRFEAGHAQLLQAARELPQQVGPLVHLAQACYYLGKHDEGEQWLRQAEALTPAHEAVAMTRRSFYSR